MKMLFKGLRIYKKEEFKTIYKEEKGK